MFIQITKVTSYWKSKPHLSSAVLRYQWVIGLEVSERRRKPHPTAQNVTLYMGYTEHIKTYIWVHFCFSKKVPVLSMEMSTHTPSSPQFTTEAYLLELKKNSSLKLIPFPIYLTFEANSSLLLLSPQSPFSHQNWLLMSLTFRGTFKIRPIQFYSGLLANMIYF